MPFGCVMKNMPGGQTESHLSAFAMYSFFAHSDILMSLVGRYRLSKDEAFD